MARSQRTAMEILVSLLYKIIKSTSWSVKISFPTSLCLQNLEEFIDSRFVSLATINIYIYIIYKQKMPTPANSSSDRCAICLNWFMKRIVIQSISFCCDLISAGCMLNFPLFHQDINRIFLAIASLIGCIMCGIIILTTIFSGKRMDRLRAARCGPCHFTRFEVE